MEVSDNLVQQYTCPICMDTLRAPVMQCLKGHPFCGECMDATIAASHGHSGGAKCPACREPLNANTISHNRTAEETMRHLKKKCENDGCNHVTSFLDYPKHARHCPYELVPCTHKTSGCTWRGKKKRLEKHLKDCRFSTVMEYVEKLRAAEQRVQQQQEALRRRLELVESKEKLVMQKFSQLQAAREFMDKRHVDQVHFKQRVMLSLENNNHARSTPFVMFSYSWQLGIERLRKPGYFGLYLKRLNGVASDAPAPAPAPAGPSASDRKPPKRRPASQPMQLSCICVVERKPIHGFAFFSRCSIRCTARCFTHFRGVIQRALSQRSTDPVRMATIYWPKTRCCTFSSKRAIYP